MTVQLKHLSKEYVAAQKVNTTAILQAVSDTFAELESVHLISTFFWSLLMLKAKLTDLDSGFLVFLKVT